MSIKILSHQRIRERAACWAQRLNEEELGSAELQDFHHWLRSDPRHAHEFRAHSAVAVMAGQLPADIGLAPNESSAGRLLALAAPVTLRRPRRIWAPAVAAAAVAALAATLLWSTTRPALPPGSFVTEVGQNLTLTLSDGSIAHVNSRSHLQWVDTPQERRVVLHRGEALFEVAHDAQRPFSVSVEDSQVRALGTRFNVYRKEIDALAEVQVTVLDGEVEVIQHARSAAEPAWRRRLVANQRLIYRDIGLMSEPQAVNAPAIARWREGVLELNDTPLPEVLGELARHSNQRIFIRDPRLAELRLGGALSTRDIRASLALIQKLAPIAVTETGKTFALDYRTDTEEKQ